MPDTPRITATGTYPRITVNVVTGATGAGGGAVDSVNGQTGVVVLDAADVGALPDDTVIPDISGLQATSEKNQPNGYAGLDGDGTIPDNRIPSSIARDTEIGTQITAHDGSGTAHADIRALIGVQQVVLWPLFPSATVGSWPLEVSTTSLYNARTNAGSHVQNDYIAWDLNLSAGTWAAQLLYLQLASGGIAHLSIDGVQVGTIDTYGATANNVTGTVTGITVTGGTQRVQLTMATKNASSTHFRLYMQALALRRTA